MYQSTSNPREGRAGLLSLVMNIVRHRPHDRRSVVCGVKIAAACWLLIALRGIASANSFSIDPVQVYLSGRATSQTLTLHYDGAEPSRFQVAAYAWEQSADGAEVLTPTKDIFFFPVLLTMKPGEEHKLRVSRAIPPAIAEKTYRLYIEQLPPPQVASKPAEVRFVTRMSLPVFVEPLNGLAQGKIDNLTLANGKVSFSIENTGNVHLKANTIRVIGRSEGEQPFTRQTSGWYVLAGGRREYQLDISADDCRKLHTISVEVETEQGAGQQTSPIKADFAPQAGSCEPQAQRGAS